MKSPEEVKSLVDSAIAGVKTEFGVELSTEILERCAIETIQQKLNIYLEHRLKDLDPFTLKAMVEHLHALKKPARKKEVQ